jgi:hypothetical protein
MQPTRGRGAAVGACTPTLKTAAASMHHHACTRARILQKARSGSGAGRDAGGSILPGQTWRDTGHNALMRGVSMPTINSDSDVDEGVLR